MRFASAFGLRLRKRWKQAVQASLTLVLLSTVTVAGFTLLGTKLLAAWKSPGDAEREAVSRSAFEGLFDFGYPSATVTRLEFERAEAERNKAQASDASVLVNRWKYTQNPILDAIMLSQNLYLTAQTLVFLEELIAIAPLSPQFRLFADQVLTGYYNLVMSLQIFVNSFIPPILRPPSIPAASPFI